MRELLGVLVLATAAAIGGAQAEDWETVRIGTEGTYPPFNYYGVTGDLTGFDIDIAKALCARIEADCTFVADDWDDMIPGLLADKYDAIAASMSITEERRKRVAFTDKYYNTPARFVAAKDAGLDTSPKGMAGKAIGAQRATTYAAYLEDNYKDSDIRLYDSQGQANRDLAGGRIAAVLADATVMYEWMRKTDEGRCCAFASEGIDAPKWFGEGVGIAIRKEDKELIARFNKAIAEIRADGTYDKINRKYFPFSIY